MIPIFRALRQGFENYMRGAYGYSLLSDNHKNVFRFHMHIFKIKKYIFIIHFKILIPA